MLPLIQNQGASGVGEVGEVLREALGEAGEVLEEVLEEVLDADFVAALEVEVAPLQLWAEVQLQPVSIKDNFNIGIGHERVWSIDNSNKQ